MKSPPPEGWVHKLMILPMDLVKEQLQNIFGEEMGGSGGPRPPSVKIGQGMDFLKFE